MTNSLACLGILLLAVAVASETQGGLCPSRCDCLQTRVTCTVDQLGLPSDIPTDTTSLTLECPSGTVLPVSPLVVGVFRGLPSLTYLTIENCRINPLPVGVFSDIPNLKYLKLSRDDITKIRPNTFVELTPVEIKLNFNRLSRVDFNVFEHLPNTTKVYLDGNPLICDCHLEPILSKFNDTNSNNVCAGSNEWTNKKWRELASDTLCPSPFSPPHPPDPQSRSSSGFVILICVVVLAFLAGCWFLRKWLSSKKDSGKKSLPRRQGKSTDSTLKISDTSDSTSDGDTSTEKKPLRKPKRTALS